MKTKLIIPLLLLTGCATMTPRQQLYTANQLYAATVDALITMRNADVFTPEEVERIDVLVEMGMKTLEQWKTDLLAGGTGLTAQEKFGFIINGLQEFEEHGHDRTTDSDCTDANDPAVLGGIAAPTGGQAD